MDFSQLAKRGRQLNDAVAVEIKLSEVLETAKASLDPRDFVIVDEQRV
jgi:hypothetical protein